MARPIRILLQTTIPKTEDDWSIERFSLLRAQLSPVAGSGKPRTSFGGIVNLWLMTVQYCICLTRWRCLQARRKLWFRDPDQLVSTSLT